MNIQWDHWLKPVDFAKGTIPVSLYPSPNITTNREITPAFIVIHYTAGASALSTAAYCSNKSSGVSYHAIIDRDGFIYQLVPFNRRAWHAGESSFGAYTDINSHSIGIALSNWGMLRRYPRANIAAWPNAYTRFLPQNTPVIDAFHKNFPAADGLKCPTWEAYPLRQLWVLRNLIFELLNRYPIQYIVGHDDIAPLRKTDPGPAFPPLPISLAAPTPSILLSLLIHPEISYPPYDAENALYCFNCKTCFSPEALASLPVATGPYPTPTEISDFLCPMCGRPLVFKPAL